MALKIELKCYFNNGYVTEKRLKAFKYKSLESANVK
ncbi:MAG: hypothetical protein JWQ14_1992 [Adhaeribacter sp.]|nr:hypothetical protein [Adhaeribacter sp.]